MNRKTMKADAWIAFRYFRTRRKVGMASVTSLITLIGVTIGTMAVLISMSVLNGFRDVIAHRTRNMEPDLKIHVRVLNASDQRDLLSDLEFNFPDYQFTPVLDRKIIVSGKKQSLMQLKGIYPSELGSMFKLEPYLKYDSFLTEDIGQTEFPQIVLGSGLAYSLNLVVGDTVTLLSPADVEYYSAPVMKAVLINMYDLDIFNYDDMTGFVHILDMQYFIDEPGWHEIYVRSTDSNPEMKLRAFLPENVSLVSWKDEHRELFAAMEMEKKGTFIVLNLIILLAGFNLVSSLIMLLLEKKWEVGILKSMGLNDKQAFRIYFILGWITGGIGMIIGLAASMILLLWQQFHPFIRLPGDVYFIKYLPVIVSPWDVVLTIAVLVMIITLASLLPARHSVKLKPLDSIKVKM